MSKAGVISDPNNQAATKGDLKEALTRVDYLLVGVVLVFALGLITFLFTIFTLFIESERFKAETYQTLVNQVTSQNTKIDTLINEKNQKRYKIKN